MVYNQSIKWYIRICKGHDNAENKKAYKHSAPHTLLPRKVALSCFSN